MTEGLRYDAGKNRLDLIPHEWVTGLGEVLTKGAAKYEPRNWEKGMKWSKVMGSLLRHVFKFAAGERYDPETGCHHMAMAAWNCLALMSYDLRRLGENDLPRYTLEDPIVQIQSSTDVAQGLFDDLVKWGGGGVLQASLDAAKEVPVPYRHDPLKVSGVVTPKKSIFTPPAFSGSSMGVTKEDYFRTEPIKPEVEISYEDLSKVEPMPAIWSVTRGVELGNDYDLGEIKEGAIIGLPAGAYKVLSKRQIVSAKNGKQPLWSYDFERVS